MGYHLKITGLNWPLSAHALTKCPLSNDRAKHLKYVQMASNSKWFNRIVGHVAGICLLRASNLSRFIEFILANAIFDTQKVKIVIVKQIHMHFSFVAQK